MPKSVQQLFVCSSQADTIQTLLGEYVSLYSNSFVQCSDVLLVGVQQVLAGLVRNKRHFTLYQSDDWTVIWEVVERSEFADPSIVKFLSKRLETEAIWVKIDHDYNLWAFQCFVDGEIQSEAFLPESYFAGFPDSDNRFDYGYCGKQAEEFNAIRSLPLFLETIPSIERKPAIARQLRRIVCKIPVAK